MLSREVIIFNSISLAITIGLSVMFYPSASVSGETSTALNTPLSAEEFEDMDLGPDYGKVPVLELMEFYMEFPPAKKAVEGAKREHFGGC